MTPAPGDGWTPPGNTRRAIGGSTGRSMPAPAPIDRGRTAIQPGDSSDRHRPTIPSGDSRDRYRSTNPSGSETINTGRGSRSPVTVAPRESGEGRSPVSTPPRGIDGSLANRYRNQLDRDVGKGARDSDAVNPIGNHTGKPTGNSAGKPTPAAPAPDRGDVTPGRVAPAPGNSVGNRYRGNGRTGATPGADTVAPARPINGGRATVAPAEPGARSPGIVVPRVPADATPSVGRGGGSSFRDWSVSPAGHSASSAIGLGCAWGGYGWSSSWWGCGPWYGVGFGFGFCSPWWYSSCHSYLGFCHSGWPSYWSSCWTPSWCRPWWCSPWWWDSCTSWDFVYGYNSVVVADYPAPSVVIVQETVSEPAEVIRSESYEAAPRERAEPPAPAVLTAKYVKLGDQYFSEGRYQQASEAYLRALGYSPEDGSIHFVLADSLFALGDYHYAAYVIRKGVELEPDLARSDVDKRKFYGKPADFERHMESLRDYIGDHPYDAAAHTVLGYNLLFTRDVAGAERSFRRVLELDAENAAAKRFTAAIDARREAERKGESLPATRKD